MLGNGVTGAVDPWGLVDSGKDHETKEGKIVRNEGMFPRLGLKVKTYTYLSTFIYEIKDTGCTCVILINQSRIFSSAQNLERLKKVLDEGFTALGVAGWSLALKSFTAAIPNEISTYCMFKYERQLTINKKCSDITKKELATKLGYVELKAKVDETSKIVTECPMTLILSI